MSRLAAFLRRLRAFSLKVRLIGAGAGLALLLALAWGSFLIYEQAATGGVGFVQPADFALPDDADVAEKKRIFFSTLRPVILAENARIERLRAEVLAAREADEPERVAEIAERFKIETWPEAGWEKLLRRVDVAPPALALAQAASESNWGQSRFAREGANFFGQWCFSEGCGLVPDRRAEGATHEVATFGSVNAAVRAYLRNLNTGSAYEGFRKLRAQARAAGRPLDPIALAGGLGRYSERGQAYIDDIRSIIRTNRALMRAPSDG